MRPSRGNDDCAISLSQGQCRIEHVRSEGTGRDRAREGGLLLFLPEGAKVGAYLWLSLVYKHTTCRPERGLDGEGFVEVFFIFLKRNQAIESV